jgi:hypothetical protein
MHARTRVTTYASRMHHVCTTYAPRMHHVCTQAGMGGDEGDDEEGCADELDLEREGLPWTDAAGERHRQAQVRAKGAAGAG